MSDTFTKDIIKEYGDVLLDPATIIDNAPPIIPLSPKLDIALGGGVPEGSLFIMTGPEKVGKDQPLTSMVYTPRGPIKMGDIKRGDSVCSPTHSFATVEDVFPQGEKDVFRVTFSDGTYAECGLNHLWKVYKKGFWSKPKVVPLSEIMSDSLFRKNGKYIQTKYSIAIEGCTYGETLVNINPYLIGVLIGDGTLKNKTVCITSIDDAILSKVKSLLDSEYELHQTSDPITYRITRKDRKYTHKQKHIYLEWLRYYNLCGKKSKDKFIPVEYKYNSKEKRLELIRGLMDTDGTVTKKGKVSFSTASLSLADDFAEVVRSLGYKCEISKRTTTCNGKTFTSYRCYVSGFNLKQLFGLNRKKERCKDRTSSLHKNIVSITYIGKEQTQCIKLNTSNGLYFTDGMTVTHNTVTALQFCKNAQKVLLEDGSRRKIMYGNVEGRLKKRDLLGVNGLDLDPDYFRVIGSTKGNILSGEKYLSIYDNLVHHVPHAIGVIDSFSALASEKELTEDIADAQVAVMQKFIAKFTRRFANVLPINRVTLVGITHIMANIGAMGNAKKKVEKSGNALKYAQDVKLYATHKEPLKQGERQIGQKINWIVENTATNTPPGQKVQSYMKYGHGIWEEMELVDLACDFGILGKSGAWVKFPNGEQAQGKPKAAEFLENDRELFDEVNNQVREMAGLE